MAKFKLDPLEPKDANILLLTSAVLRNSPLFFYNPNHWPWRDSDFFNAAGIQSGYNGYAVTGAKSVTSREDNGW